MQIDLLRAHLRTFPSTGRHLNAIQYDQSRQWKHCECMAETLFEHNVKVASSEAPPLKKERSFFMVINVKQSVHSMLLTGWLKTEGSP